MKLKRLSRLVLFCSILSAVLSACSSKQLYQKWDGSEGYLDSTINQNLTSQPSGVLRVSHEGPIKDSVYLVKFYGSRTEDGAWCGAMYRVAEFTVEHGNDYFNILRDTIELVQPGGGNENGIISGAVSGHRVKDPNAGLKGPGSYSQPRPVCSKTFAMGHGVTPVGAFNAKEVLSQYRGEIRIPTD